MNAERSPPSKFVSPSSLLLLALTLLIVHLTVSAAVLQGSPNVLERFPGDYYKVEGSPEIAASLERATVYQGEETSLYLALTNRGNLGGLVAPRVHPGRHPADLLRPPPHLLQRRPAGGDAEGGGDIGDPGAGPAISGRVLRGQLRFGDVDAEARGGVIL